MGDPVRPDAAPASRWPRIRAILLAFVLLFHGLASLPMPRVLKADRASTDMAAEELNLWVGVLSRVGVTATPAELVKLVNYFAEGATSARQTIFAPVQPILRITQTGQAWALFSYPDRFPDRLIVEGRAGEGDWETLFRALDPEHQLLGPQLRFRRIRGVYDTAASRSAPGQVYERFVNIVAGEVFAARPDLDSVRVRVLQFHVVLPGVKDSYGEKSRFARTRTRAELASP